MGGLLSREQRAWGSAAAEEEPKQRRSTMEHHGQSVRSLLSLKLGHLTSEIQHWGDTEVAERTEGKRGDKQGADGAREEGKLARQEEEENRKIPKT